MSGACGFCVKSCRPCRNASNRLPTSFRLKGEWISAVLIKDQDALEILGCTKAELNRYIKRGKIRTAPGRTSFRLVYDDVVSCFRGTMQKLYSRADVLSGIVNAIHVYQQVKIKEYADFDLKLRDMGLLPDNRMFPFGNEVDTDVPPKVGWYVYHLCYPSGKVFYIGKGIGNRMYNHVIEAKQGVKNHKCNVIRKILLSGELRYKVVFVTTNEIEAYEYEKLEIARHGLGNLTNISSGGYLSIGRAKALGLHGNIGNLNRTRFLQLLPSISGRAKLTRARASVLSVAWASRRMLLLALLRLEAIKIRYDQAVEIIKREEVYVETFLMEQQRMRGI